MAAHALLHATRPAPNQAVALEGLVILDVLGELAEGVGARRALCAAEEGHVGNERCAKCTVVMLGRRIKCDKGTVYGAGEELLQEVRGNLLRHIDQQLMDGVAWWGWLWRPSDLGSADVRLWQSDAEWLRVVASQTCAHAVQFPSYRKSVPVLASFIILVDDIPSSSMSCTEGYR